MKSKKVWIVVILILVLAVATFFFWDSMTALVGGMSGQASAAATQPDQMQQTVAIRPAAEMNQVSAAGNIALASQQAVVLQVEGIVTDVAVKPGDRVAVGDHLVALDTTDLQRAVQRTELSLAISQNELEQMQEPASPGEIAAARADMVAAQENLRELQAGPGAAELEAAQAALIAAQESYQDLLNGQSEAELTQLSAEMHKAFITLQQAQEAYNQIAYRGDVGGTQQAMDLQTATIDYDTAKAAYEVATESASAAEMQEALKGIKDAQAQLEALQATQAELASAEAGVAQAEATLADLLDGPNQVELQAAKLSIEQAQLDLQEDQASLEQAQLRAPADGAILTVDVEVGQQATAGLSAVTMADLTNLELPVYVAEVDISKLEIGQPVNIAMDALPNQVFSGEVSRIAPTSQADSSVVNYEVTIRLNDLELDDGVRPGMTAVATILGDESGNSWLVPTTSIREIEGKPVVMVMRDGQPSRVSVTPGASQGEWTMVQSDALQAGDQVAGRVTSFVGEDQGPRFGGGGIRMMGGPPPQ